MNHSNTYKGHRNSYTELHEVYFWTITIRGWITLLKDDKFKMKIIGSLQWLCEKELIKIYGYVIMPNHLHLLWEQLKMNGKEFPKNSFEKFTSHQFLKILKTQNSSLLNKFQVNACDRRHNFWQRDPLAIRIYGREMCVEKLDYTHYNPLQDHWRLALTPEDYRFSSASFYECGVDEFGILTHYTEAL